MEDNINEGLSDIISSAVDGHWGNCAAFCRDGALNPLLVFYRDLVPILNVFAQQYGEGAITLSIQQVQFCMIEYIMHSIDQAMSDMGDRDPHLKIQG